MKNFLKVLGVIFLVFIIIALFAGIFGGSDSSVTKDSDTTTQIKEEPKQTPDIEVVQHNLKKDDFFTHVYVVLKNNSNKNASYIDINSYFIDESGNIIGRGIGNSSDFAAGATKTIDIMCADDVSTAKSYKVELGNVIW
jgi:hypothetical protein